MPRQHVAPVLSTADLKGNTRLGVAPDAQLFAYCYRYTNAASTPVRGCDEAVHRSFKSCYYFLIRALWYPHTYSPQSVYPDIQDRRYHGICTRGLP